MLYIIIYSNSQFDDKLHLYNMKNLKCYPIITIINYVNHDDNKDTYVSRLLLSDANIWKGRKLTWNPEEETS